MNQSEIDVSFKRFKIKPDLKIMFTTGVGIRVQESRGLLNIIVALPENYREVHTVS
jgi:hypothetical protein